MQAPLFIGVDGGGSGCRARIRDARGRVLGEGSGGAANVSVDRDGSFESIRAAGRAAAAAAGLPERDLRRMHAGLGLAGAGPHGQRSCLHAERHPFATAVIGTDSYVAWLGAHAGEDGAVVILGTGSCGYGRVAGAWHYIGGWGAELSDEAGGQALGRAALRHALHAFDGLDPATPLAEEMLRRFDGSAQAIAAFARGATPGDYAALAPPVLGHATAGDALALEIVGKAASHAAGMIARLLDVGMPAVCLTGGLAGPLEPFLPAEIRATLAPPRHDALDGAILMARQAVSSEPGAPPA